MLYNKDWDKPKPAPGTWASVIAWLETKDPEERYSYWDSDSCLAAQYNDSIHRIYEVPFIGAIIRLPWRLMGFDGRLETLARYGERTFGAALARAKARA